MTGSKIAYNISSKEQERETNIWWIYPRKWLSHQNKKSKAVKNWTIKKVEDQNKNFESKGDITYTTENIEQNNRKYSIGKNGINNRVKKYWRNNRR